MLAIMYAFVVVRCLAFSASRATCVVHYIFGLRCRAFFCVYLALQRWFALPYVVMRSEARAFPVRTCELWCSARACMQMKRHAPAAAMPPAVQLLSVEARAVERR
jgi:hypothetical protein